MTWNLIKVNHNSSVLAVIIIINMAMYLRVIQSTSSGNLMLVTKCLSLLKSALSKLSVGP